MTEIFHSLDECACPIYIDVEASNHHRDLNNHILKVNSVSEIQMNGYITYCLDVTDTSTIEKELFNVMLDRKLICQSMNVSIYQRTMLKVKSYNVTSDKHIVLQEVEELGRFDDLIAKTWDVEDVDGMQHFPSTHYVSTYKYCINK